MSLFGALSLGGSSLAAQQTALQVTGNNIANAGTAGYSRQVVGLASNPDILSSSGQYVGSGVTVASIQRQVSAALNEGFRSATSDQHAADMLNSQLTQLQGIFGALEENDLSSQLTTFFNSFSTLANNPTDSAQRSVVIQNGVSLAQNLQSLRGRLSTLRENAQAQIAVDAKSADALAKQIAELNAQIATMGSPPSAANSLMDQRDAALTELSKLMDIRVVDQGGGDLMVLVGSVPLVSGSTTHGVTTRIVGNSPTGVNETRLVFADSGDQINVSGGELGGLINARENYVVPAIATVDNLAAGLITAVNSIHTQGHGLAGFSTVTATAQNLDPSALLNSSTTGLAFTPVNGTFSLYMTDTTTGLVTAKQIKVNLSGAGTETSLTSLAAAITTAGGGSLTVSVDGAGRLTISAADSHTTFGFGEDTSGVLASLGINTFFKGSSASDIAVNEAIRGNSDFLAAGRGNVRGSNQNAQALALAGAAVVQLLGGRGVKDFYTAYIGDLASAGKTAADDSTAQRAIRDTLFSQQQAISGVSMDEEAINLTQYQRAFQGSARFITVVDEMLQTVLGLIG